MPAADVLSPVVTMWVTLLGCYIVNIVVGQFIAAADEERDEAAEDALAAALAASEQEATADLGGWSLGAGASGGGLQQSRSLKRATSDSLCGQGSSSSLLIGRKSSGGGDARRQGAEEGPPEGGGAEGGFTTKRLRSRSLQEVRCGLSWVQVAYQSGARHKLSGTMASRTYQCVHTDSMQRCVQ